MNEILFQFFILIINIKHSYNYFLLERKISHEISLNFQKILLQKKKI